MFGTQLSSISSSSNSHPQEAKGTGFEALMSHLSELHGGGPKRVSSKRAREDSGSSGSDFSDVDESDDESDSGSDRKRVGHSVRKEVVRGGGNVLQSAKRELLDPLVVINKIGYFIDQLTQERMYWQGIQKVRQELSTST